MTQIAITGHCKPSRRFSLTSLWDALALQRQRRSLAQLDERALEDIGVTRAQADLEARRPVWDAPDYWCR